MVPLLLLMLRQLLTVLLPYDRNNNYYIRLYNIIFSLFFSLSVLSFFSLFSLVRACLYNIMYLYIYTLSHTHMPTTTATVAFYSKNRRCRFDNCTRILTIIFIGVHIIIDEGTYIRIPPSTRVPILYK